MPGPTTLLKQFIKDKLLLWRIVKSASNMQDLAILHSESVIYSIYQKQVEREYSDFQLQLNVA